MKLLQWNPSFSIGVASVDDEHREMIDLINDVYEKLSRNPDAEQIDECLGDVFDAISIHFALEERLMLDSHYAEYQAHKNDHEELLDEIRDLMDKYYGDPEPDLTELQRKLSDWFVHHFSTFDARLHGKLGR